MSKSQIQVTRTIPADGYDYIVRNEDDSVCLAYAENGTEEKYISISTDELPAVIEALESARAELRGRKPEIAHTLLAELVAKVAEELTGDAKGGVYGDGFAHGVSAMRDALHSLDVNATNPVEEARKWLIAFSDWLLTNDYDMTLPDGILDTDPLDIADRLKEFQAQADR